MQGFTRGKFRVHNFLNAAKKIDGLLLLNLPCLQCTGERRQLLTHTFLFHHHSVQLALKSANEQFRLRIICAVPRDRIAVINGRRLLGSIIGGAARTGHIRVHGFSANVESAEEEAREASDAHKTTYDPRPAASVKHTVMMNMSKRSRKGTLFDMNAF